MRGVVPLKQANKHFANQAKPLAKKIVTVVTEPTQPDVYLSDNASPELTPEQFVSYKVSGIQPRYFKKLQQGRFTVEAEIDLHGQSIAQARKAMVEFMCHTRRQGMRCVRIVHGKGFGDKNRKATLKNQVTHWLSQFPYMIAFCSCQPKHGGTGALYVLLER